MVGMGGTLATVSTAFAATKIPTRKLWVHRVQSKEEGRVVYFQDDNLVQDGYYLLCYLLRDVRAEQITRMDLRLIHLLFGMQAWMRACGIRQPLRINSGYRTAETNANTEGAAVHSQHVTGKAVDLTVDGIPSAVLAKLAKKFNAGGVGTYSSFVHVDTGPVRFWNG
ncbi:MAG: YcbK family protein [Candidatus Competibacteraceae bacterium]|nr:YcbK family protein [Candidatus Competibacteraceae bacterium]